MERSHDDVAPQRLDEPTGAQLPRELRDPDARTGSPRAEDARRRLRAVRRQASDSLQRAGDAARVYTRDYPAAVAFAAFGTGLAAGLLLAQRRSASRTWRTAVPAVAAVADAVLEVFDRRRR
jgi:hypothetical protein